MPQLTEVTKHISTGLGIIVKSFSIMGGILEYIRIFIIILDKLFGASYTFGHRYIQFKTRAH